MGSVAELRGRVATAVETLEGWHVSRWPAELFGREPDARVHHAFAVGMPRSVPHPKEPRQRVAEGLLCTSTVEVLWAHRLRGDALVGDYDAALDAEQALVGVVLAIAEDAVTCTGLTRRAVAEGWLLGTSQFEVVHRFEFV